MKKESCMKKKCKNIVDRNGKKEICGYRNRRKAKRCAMCGAELPNTNNMPILLGLLIAALFFVIAITISLRNRNNTDFNKVEITVKPSVDTMGTVLGGGIYIKDTVIELVPCPSDGFVFDMWDDGNRDNPRWVKTVEDHKYVAIFKKEESPINLGSGTTNHTDHNNPAKLGNPEPPLSIQQVFDELCGRFELRMKDELTYENALVLITGDYEVLEEILQMLDNCPNLTADTRNHYIERFQNRADEAIKKINDAVFSTSLDSYQGEELYSKYIPQKSKIEQIRNSL